MKIHDLLDVTELERLTEERYIRAVQSNGFTLYNYAPRAQWERMWNDVTLVCRGLVVSPDGDIQTRPFRKFFNVSEHDDPALPDLPVEPFIVQEKVDGSLISVSRLESGELLFTTRGSFESLQAKAAEELWMSDYRDVEVPYGQTWCFEYIAPWNRIVVRYNATELVFLAALDNATGEDLPHPEWPGRKARHFDGLADFDEVYDQVSRLGDNEEGFVIRFDSGVRAKIKGETYLRLHKALTGTTKKSIWELLSSGEAVASLYENTPDEFQQWCMTTIRDFHHNYDTIKVAAVHRFDEILSLPTRKDQALAIKDDPNKAIIFKMLDGKNYSDTIWKMIKPSPMHADPDGDVQLWKLEM